MFCDKKIESFESVVLKTSGMRSRSVFEIKQKDGEAEISESRLVCREGGGTGLVPLKAVRRSTAEVLELLNKCGLLEWNGFNGAHPHGVNDGTVFELCAVVNGGERISANGSQNFPNHYSELSEWLYKTLYENDNRNPGAQA